MPPLHKSKGALAMKKVVRIFVVLSLVVFIFNIVRMIKEAIIVHNSFADDDEPIGV